MQALQGWIKIMQEKIWLCEFKEVQNNFVTGIEFLGNLVKELPNDKVAEYNMFLGEIIDSVGKSDYLLLSDLLEYKLNNFMELVENNKTGVIEE